MGQCLIPDPQSTIPSSIIMHLIYFIHELPEQNGSVNCLGIPNLHVKDKLKTVVGGIIFESQLY